jgi:hypothetical protein
MVSEDNVGQQMKKRLQLELADMQQWLQITLAQQ